MLDGKVVLHRTEKGNLNFPKGKIKKAEAPEQAAIREVLEETGLLAEPIESLGTLALRHIARPQEIEFFLMRANGPSAAWTEHLGRDAELVALDEVVERLTFKEYRRFWRQVAGRVAGSL